MKSLIKYTISLFVYWLFVFFINRIFFVVYQLPIGLRIHEKIDFVKSFYKGYQLDFATSVILLLLPMLCSVLYFIFQKNSIARYASYLILLCLVLYNCASIGDAGLYKEWNAKINLQALEHFKNPIEVFRTISIKIQLMYVALVCAFTIPFYFLYKRKIHPIVYSTSEMPKSKKVVWGIVYFLISTGISIIIIRGGITNLPINQSVAYFSNDVLANDMAVNPFYNLMQDLTIKQNIPDPSIYKFRSNEEAQQLIADDFIVDKDSTINILLTKRPNLVFIFLESWSADNISALGGIEGCTPQFNKLCNEGILFTKAYSNAYVSDQGIPAVLSAYPSVSRVAIINQPMKVPKLECISQDVLPLGYTSSFMFGGDLVYGNLRGYMLEKKFVNLKEEKDFPQYPKGQLGIHDEYMFPELLKTLNQLKEPFLQGFFTTSTHMPYDYTTRDTWQSTHDDPEKKYTESVHYSDAQLGRFFEQAKTQAWYKNTLFVVVADHSHNTIKQTDPLDPEHHHIPLLFLGGALNETYRGTKWNKIVSQLDIASTLLHQMNVDSKHYVWSRNMFNPATPSTAYYVVFGAAGYICDQGFAGTHQQSNFIQHSPALDTNLVLKFNNKAMSFQQLVYEDVKNRK